MKKLWLPLVLTVFGVCVTLRAQTLMPDVVIRLDAALDRIVARDAKLEMLKTDYYGISEGPVWVQDGASGYLVFSEIAGNVIHKWTPGNNFSVFLEKTGFSGDDLQVLGRQAYFGFDGIRHIANIGSNGVTLDPQGRLVWCAQGDRSIVRLEKDGTRTVLASRFDGKRLNRPNDLVIRSDGTVYFADPRPDANPAVELPYSAVFSIKDGKVALAAQTDFRPNGIALSPDEKILYVNALAENQIIAYDIQPDGSIGRPRVFFDMSADKAPGGADGLKVDVNGNVYSTGPGGVWIITPQGKHIGTLRMPERTTNLAFGDADGKTLYLTIRRSLGRIRLNTAGVMPGPKARPS